MATETDTLPLLPPSAIDDPPSFDSHSEFNSPAAARPRPRTRLQSAPLLPTKDSSPTGSPTDPFRSPQSSLNQQSLPRNSTDTDDASLLPAYTPAKYRGHATEEEYLAALRAWAEEKLYTQPADKSTLVGFYGAETMKERIARQPPLKMRIGRKRKESKMGESVVQEGQGVQEDEAVVGKVVREQGNGEAERRRRRSSIGNWLSRKRTN
ncbi:MAG: hypothetical protein ALECFALPRED_007165 [Alectoria fallacina]|uniref:Uncharacterized protein n=1 Tax=Alectoria fallacina TaxID=1903189 RepID=A0A8H3G3A1_9LECA|nr:MAG: hypothetical protein ALECFALPRED_007165 [Alectoria fallacina]